MSEWDDLWTVTEEGLREIVEENREEILADGITHWLECNFHLMKDGQTHIHIMRIESILNTSEDRVMRLSDELRDNGDVSIEGSTKAAQLLRDFITASEFNGVYDYKNTIYVRFMDGERIVLAEPTSSQFKRYLVALHYNRYRDMITERTYKKVVLNITSLPVTEVELSRRVAQRGEAFFFDLSSNDGQVVMTTKDGWSIVVPDEPIFLWVDHAEPAYMPFIVEDPVEIIDKLFEFINMDQKYGMLQKIAFIFSFMPKSPQPITVVHGEHGSAKSYFSKVWKRFVDPSVADTATFVKDEGKLIHTLGSNWFIAFDNVSGISQVQSDILCQASTGGAFQTRKLYTDGDSFSRDLRSVVVLNGINVTPNQPDLLRRCLLFFFPHIKQSARMSEEYIDMNIDAMGNDVMGAVFTIISKAMNVVENYRDIPNKPVMADFAVWGCAIADALGLDAQEFLTLYRHNRNLQSEEVIKNDMIGTVIKDILDRAVFVEGLFMVSKEDLLMDITQDVEQTNPILLRDKYFPKTLIALTRKMERLRPTLRELGYEYSEERRMYRGQRTRILVFKRTNLPDFPSLEGVPLLNTPTLEEGGRGKRVETGEKVGHSGRKDQDDPLEHLWE